jgi:DNA polymerase III alpha subunit
MIPIFSTHHSFRSILTFDDPDKIIDSQVKNKIPKEQAKNLLDTESVSVFNIAREYSLKEIYVADGSFSGFIKAYTVAQKNKISLRYGIKFWICQNLSEKTDESLRTESKITIWMLNSAAEKDLIKLYNHSWQKDNFYYQNRLDWTSLKRLWTPNLGLSIDHYDGFLAKNFLKNGCCVPDLGFIKPSFDVCDMGLPFDDLIKQKTLSFCAENNYKIRKTHPIYYYSRADSLPYQVFRCIKERTTLQKPNLDHFSSNNFCWQSFCEKTGTEFKDYAV